MKKILLFLCFFCMVTSSLSAEVLTLVTYYPAPVGAYRQIRLIPYDTIAQPIVCSDANEGLMFYDDNTGLLTFCANDGINVKKQSTTWVQEGDFLTPADTADDIFIGIGDFTPEAFLEISMSGLGHDYLYLSSNDFLDGNILKVNNSGRLGINSSNPDFKLSLDEDLVGQGSADGGILAFGRIDAGADLNFAGEGTRFMWYPKKCAFRAGYVDGDQWDNTEIGKYSLAMGMNSAALGLAGTALSSGIASGDYSTAMGLGARSPGPYATAIGLRVVSAKSGSTTLGLDSTASDDYTVSFGDTNASLAAYAVTLGFSNVADDIYAVAIGDTSTASGSHATVLGQSNNAQNAYSVVLGKDSQSLNSNNLAVGHGVTVSGQYATAMGNYATASGTGSFALAGNGATAQSYASVVLGKYNVIAGDSFSYVAQDPLFVIGNGIDSANRNNVWTIVKDGNLTIGSGTNEGYMLRVRGGSASVDAANQWKTDSDERLKKDILPLTGCLASLAKIRGVRYKALNDPENETAHIGFIAQEIEPVYPEFVVTALNGYKSVSYDRVSAVLIEAVKELRHQNTAMESEMQSLRKQLDNRIIELMGE